MSVSAEPPALEDPSSSIVEIGIDGEIDVERNAPVVVIPVYGQPALFERCLRSVLRHTSPDIHVLIADDATPDGSILEVVRRLDREGLGRPVHVMCQPQNRGFPENVNAAIQATAPGDVVLLNSDCEVGAEWLERLRAAAYSDSLIATATSLTNNGTILSVPRGKHPSPKLPEGHDTESAAAAVARFSSQIRPRITTGVGHCLYIRRSAIELVGLLDPIFSPGYGEEVDFCQRCSRRGLVHVAADDVYTYHAGGASLSPSHKDDHEELLRDRYPEYHWALGTLVQRKAGPLERALSLAEVALTGLSVTVDARCLGPTVTGTQILVLELLRELARNELRLRALIPTDIAPATLEELVSLGIEALRADDVPDDVERSAIVHRPYQVAHPVELALLDRLGHRIVISHLDLIAYRTPGYARSPMEWLDFQRLTRSVLAIADIVLFISQHAADDAIAEELIDASRARVVHLGVEDARAKPEIRPTRLPPPIESGYMLYVGTDFRHKNRLFALEVLEELLARHNWDGSLVFAGPHAASGTSADDEAAFLAARPDVAARVVSVGSITEAEKAWLYRRAGAVIYPTTYEGFGLIPFEAAAFGRPTLFAAQTALVETLPGCETLVPWDAKASADAVYTILSDERAARRLTEAIATRAVGMNWRATAEGVLRVYEEVIRMPAREIRSVHDASTAESIVAMREIAVSFSLSPLARRALTSLLYRRRLRRLFLPGLILGFRLGYRLKHGVPPDERGI